MRLNTKLGQNALYLSTGCFSFYSNLTRTLFSFALFCFVLMSLGSGSARATETSAEPGGSVRVWTTSEGMPANSVTAILQTRDGYLWIGTSAGLVRFDGVKFTSANLLDASSNNAVRVTALCEDSRGDLWVGTQQNGLFALNENGTRHFTKQSELLDDNVTSLAADNEGFVWIGTRAGLNHFDGRDFRSFTTREGLPDDLISGLHVARSGTVWITTRSGMCRFINGRMVPYAFQTDSQGRSPEYLGAYEDRRGNLWAFGDTYLINLAEGKRFNYFRGTETASMRIWSLCEGRDGTLWIGTSGRGLFCFGENRFQPVVLGELRWPYDVRAICEDREGNLWLGTTSGGLVQLSRQPAHVFKSGQGLPSGAPTALAMDSGGRIHVGLQRGGLFAGDGERFERLATSNNSEVQDFISALCTTPDGTIWAGTIGGGVYGLKNGRGIRITTANGLADDMIFAVCADKTGNVWASTSAGTVHRVTAQTIDRFDKASGLTGTSVTAMIPSGDGGLWLGTQNGSILHGDAEGKFFPANADTTRHRITALFEGDHDRLWIGTAGGGLHCLEKETSRNWNTSNGLPSDAIAGIVEDSAKNLWLATAAGIYRVNGASVHKAIEDAAFPFVCKLMSEAKSATEPTTFAGGTRALLGLDGKLWFATSEGVLMVDTDQPEFAPTTLPVYIETVAFNGESPSVFLRRATNAAPERIPGGIRSLEIHYTALSFAAPEKIRFRHKLEGFDPDWIEDASARFVRYSRLPYGNYRFRVAARNPDGAWQEAVNHFAFIVPTPVYLRTWAIVLYGIFALALITGIVRVVSHRRLRGALALLEQQQALERERMRIARDMHDDMGSKLTKISFLSEHAKVDAQPNPRLAGKIESIAETSRELLQSMDEIVWVVNPRNDTLEHLAAYLSHYAVEYFQNTSVECDLRLPRAIPDYPLSSEARHNLFLTFEESLNNVLKHSQAAKVKVEMTLQADDFEINISDNGHGFDATKLSNASHAISKKRGGNGLKNMRQRLADVGGEFLIRSEPGAGTTITLRIPLSKKRIKKL